MVYNSLVVKVQINNKTKFNFKYKRLFKKIAKVTIDILKIHGKTEVSVIIVDNKLIKGISKQYRNKDVSTDILSFPSDYLKLKKLIGYNLLGDIFLSFEKIEEQANKFNHSSKREWSYLFVHGLLHLIGYDHKTLKEEKNMNKIAYQVMDLLKIKRK